MAPATGGISIAALAALLEGRKVVALTGAGCSTESGIPDYRGPKTREQARNPIQHREFLADAHVRRRYWARAMVGWSRFSVAKPNAAHRTLAQLEHDGVLTGLITQNVDRLHHAAGSEHVVELHGALAEAVCLDCGRLEDRRRVQSQMLEHNDFAGLADAPVAPDGDAELHDAAIADFKVPVCATCGGTLKPNVVFFGGTVPAPTVTAAYALFEASDALLVVGSSLAVFSGYRFLRAAAKRAIPTALVNLGPARGQDLIDVHVDGRAGELLPRLREELLAQQRRGN